MPGATPGYSTSGRCPGFPGLCNIFFGERRWIFPKKTLIEFVKLQHIFENSRNSNLPFFCHIGLFQPLIKFCQNCNNTVINSSQWRWEYEFWAGIYFGINLSTVWNRYFQSKLWIFSLKRRVSDVSQEPNSSVSICNKCLQILCLFILFSSHFKRNFRSPLSVCFHCWAHQPTCRIPSIHLPIYLGFLSALVLEELYQFALSRFWSLRWKKEGSES